MKNNGKNQTEKFNFSEFRISFSDGEENLHFGWVEGAKSQNI